MAGNKKKEKVESELMAVAEPVAKTKTRARATEEVAAKTKMVKATPKVMAAAQPVTKAKSKKKADEKSLIKPQAAPQESQADAGAGGDAPATNKAKKPNLMRERHEKIVRLKREYAVKGARLTHREIVRHFGCSFTTAGNLAAYLTSLKSCTVVNEAVISDALLDGIKVEIIRNVEAYRDAIEEKLELIAAAEAALDGAIKLLEKIIRNIK